jgi:hypothetical protein
LKIEASLPHERYKLPLVVIPSQQGDVDRLNFDYSQNTKALGPSNLLAIQLPRFKTGVSGTIYCASVMPIDRLRRLRRARALHTPENHCIRSAHGAQQGSQET